MPAKLQTFWPQLPRFPRGKVPELPRTEVPISTGRKASSTPPPHYGQGRGGIPTSCPVKSSVTFWDHTPWCTRKSLQKFSRQSFDLSFPVSTSRLFFSQCKSPAVMVHLSFHQSAVRSDGAQLSIKTCQCASLGSLVPLEGLPATFMEVLLLLPLPTFAGELKRCLAWKKRGTHDKGGRPGGGISTPEPLCANENPEQMRGPQAQSFRHPNSKNGTLFSLVGTARQKNRLVIGVQSRSPAITDKPPPKARPVMRVIRVSATLPV